MNLKNFIIIKKKKKVKVKEGRNDDQNLNTKELGVPIQK